MYIEGTVEDYDTAFRNDVKASVASTAGVNASAVSVMLTPASVLLTITVSTDSSAAGTSVLASLESVLATAAAASTFLGANVTSKPATAVSARVVRRAGPVSLPEYEVPALLVTHSLLMGIAWLVLAPLGVVVSRFGKPAPGAPPKAGGGPATWYIVHRATQMLAVLFSIVGIVLSIPETDTTYGQHLFNAHTGMGVALSAVMLVQPLLAFARPAKDAASRPAWSAFHKLLGYALCVAAVVNCILGATDIGMLYQIGNRSDSTGDTLKVLFIVLGGAWLGIWCVGEAVRLTRSGDATGKSSSTIAKSDLQINQC